MPGVVRPNLGPQPRALARAGGQLDFLSDQVAWRQGLRGPPDFYRPVITSYDYGSPLSEAGLTGQPGLGGPDGFQARARARGPPRPSSVRILCGPPSAPPHLCHSTSPPVGGSPWRAPMQPLCYRPAGS
jgi:hypothetical protein